MKSSRWLITGLHVFIVTFSGLLVFAPLQAQSRLPGVSEPEKKSETLPKDEEKVIKLEPFQVTGTNIKRMDMENVLPMTIIDVGAISVRDAITPVEMLLSLPEVTGPSGNEGVAGGTSARGGHAAIGMRGMGAGNSLILLDGRRLVGQPFAGMDVNANQLPTRGMDSIDVLRDGASSIYGSDAVAGVINYRMRTDFRGTELKLRYSHPESPGGQNAGSTLTHGMDFAGGKGRLLSTLTYMWREAIYLHDRDFSKSANQTYRAPAPWNVSGSMFDGRTSVGPYPRFSIGTATANNYFMPVNGVMTLTSVAPSRPANEDFYTDPNQHIMGMPRTRRLNWYNKIEYDINSRITAFADLSFYKADSIMARQWVRINAPTTDSPGVMSADNPFNPYGSRFYSPTGAPNADGTSRLTGTPRTVNLLAGAIADIPLEKIVVSDGIYRLVAGLRGKLTDTWNWEVGALGSRLYSSDSAPPGVRESLFGQALMRTDNTAFNPFGYTFKVQGTTVVADRPYQNPESVMSTFVRTWRKDARSEIASLDARAAGRVYSIWSGDISLAVGGEFRGERFKHVLEPFAGLNPAGSGLNPLNNDFIFATPVGDSFGDRTVASAYAETIIPLVAPKNGIPLIKSLELTGAVRHERYSDFGNTNKPKVGLNWKPFGSVMVRGSLNEGFTAPSLTTLYAPSR